MKTSKIHISLICIFSSLFVLGQEHVIKIIESTDVHGAIYPYKFTYDTTTNYINTEQKHICTKVMNFMEYDAATVGNHDIEAGHPVYDKLSREFDFPWLAANAISKESGEPYFPPYSIINLKGFKIAIFGMVTPGIPNWLPEKLWEGIEFRDMVETAQEWIPKIIESEKPDLVIGLFHSGVEHTYGEHNAQTFKNPNAIKLVAQAVEGIDIIFAGHDHRQYNFTMKGPSGDDVLIIDPGSHAKYAGVATIHFNFNKKTQSFEKNISGEIIDLQNYRPDGEFMIRMRGEMEVVKEYLNKPIGENTSAIYSRDCFFGCAAFTDLIHLIQLEISGAEISFTSPLSFNTEIMEGPLYVRDLFKLYKFENQLLTMKLKGNEIDDYLEFSYAYWFNHMKHEDDHLLKFRKDSLGNLVVSQWDQKYRLENDFFNFSTAAGISYTVDVSKPEFERVEIYTLADGSAFDTARTYTVAVNSYRGSGGGGHLTIGAKLDKAELAGRLVTVTERDLRYHVLEWITNKKIIYPVKIDNWKVIPQTWWEKGKKQDYEILFPDHD